MLTKSAYMEFLRCPNEFWLAQHSPSPTDDDLTLEHKHRREQGYEIQRQAQKMSIFQTGIVSFQMRFVSDECWTSADVVVTDPATQEISIYEVKSGASVKADYVADLAFQVMVAESLGHAVAGAYVITVDTTYVRNGELDPDKLLKVTDVTEEVRALQEATREQTKAAFTYLEAEPVASLTEFCDAKLDCKFIRHHFPDIPEYNVTNIARLSSDKCIDLLTRNITDIRHVPADFKLSAKQRKQVEIACGTDPHIDPDGIRAELSELKYPLNFLDYESFSYAVPHYEGIRPYQQMLFQYSLHTISEPGAEPTHRFRLARANDLHPAREIVEGLYSDLSESVGTIVVWHRQFEAMCTSQLALLYPEFCEFLQSVNTAIFDLKNVFAKGHYIHPEFRGSASIKKVLPVLCPELRYDELDIGDGITAAIKWYHMATRRGGDAECDKIYNDLCAYCHLDTLAMVKIFEVLRRECGD